MVTPKYSKVGIDSLDGQWYAEDTRDAPPAEPSAFNDLTDDEINDLIAREVWNANSLSELDIQMCVHQNLGSN